MRRPQTIWLILLLALATRLIFLGQFPLGFTADEASQGYSAYSLLKTGQDEWGLTWPISSFRAFADYRAPLQTYLIIPSVAVFGLNEFAVRLPSAIVGTLAVLAIFLLTNKLFKNKNIALLAALFLAISPWHLQFSRTALEANFASFLFPMGLYFLLRGIDENKKYLFYAALLFGLDLYSYLAAKLFVVLFLAGFFILERKQFKKIVVAKTIPALLLFFVFALPIFTDTFFGPGNVRGKDLIITNYSLENIQSISKEQYYSTLNQVSTIIPRIFSNKLTFTFHQFVTNYVSYLTPSFWFTEGGRESTYSVFPGFGLLYLFMLPLVAFGIFKLLTSSRQTRNILLLWFFLGIIPAAITKEGYRPNRAGSLLGIMEIVSAVGFYYLFTSIPAHFRKLFVWASALTVLTSFIFFINLYYFVSPVRYPDSLSYGYREVIQKVDAISSQYDNIIFDRGSESHIFVAFYSQMDPQLFQQYSKEWWSIVEDKNLLFVDMINPYRLGKFTFKTFDASSDLLPGNLVIIGAKKYNPGLGAEVIDRIDYPDQTPAFYLLTYVQEK